MSEIAKCRCGAEAVIRVAGDLDTLHPVWYFVTCATGCHISGPWCSFEDQAIAAWNDLMRPRPVAKWVPAEGLCGDECHGFVGSLGLGQVALGYVSVHRTHGIVNHAAQCHIDGKGQYFLDPNPASARAWLEARARAAGFDVREDVSDD